VTTLRVKRITGTETEDGRGEYVIGTEGVEGKELGYDMGTTWVRHGYDMGEKDLMC
jgi:hypothetical protein